MKRQLYWLVGLLAFLAGCNYPNLAPAASLTPTSAGAEPQTSVPSPSILPAETTVPETLPPTPNPACLPSGEAGALEASAYGDYPGAIEEYLNEGASPAALDNALADAGVGNVPRAVVAADLTGDGVMDIAVSIFNPQSQAILPPGTALIYVCTSGRYSLADMEDSLTGFGAFHLWYVQDLDADGAAEVVVSQPTCGAHTCFDDLEVLSWDGAGFSNRLEGDSLDLPYPDVRVDDADGDGVYDLSVVAGGIGSVGAGPQREVTRRWVLDPASRRWLAAGDLPGPSNFRIHILHDAETALRDGEVEQALALYERVAVDPTLDDWVDPETERANLAAYARFKQVVGYLLLGQADFARTALDGLQAAYPGGSAQHAYVMLGEAFWAGWETGGLPAGCAAAEAFAGEHAGEVLAPLGPAAFGYANPEIHPADMCP